MKRIFIISLLFCVSSAALLAQSVQPITNEDIFFFEYLFTSVSALSGTPQLDHVQHFKLTDSEAEVLIKFAVAFKSQEATLTQQANMQANRLRCWPRLDCKGTSCCKTQWLTLCNSLDQTVRQGLRIASQRLGRQWGRRLDRNELGFSQSVGLSPQSVRLVNGVARHFMTEAPVKFSTP